MRQRIGLRGGEVSQRGRLTSRHATTYSADEVTKGGLVAKNILRSAGLALCIVVGAGSAVPTFADCHDTNSAIGSTSSSIGNSTQQSSWYHTSSVDQVYINVSNNNITTPGLCLNEWYDWATVTGHYDVRLVRNCADNQGRQPTTNGVYVEPSSSRTLKGLQKAAGCSSNGLYVKDMNQCSQATQNSCNIPLVNEKPIPNDYTRDWTRSAGGSPGFDGGGDPTDPDN